MVPTSSHGLPVWLLLLGTLGAIIGFSWSEEDYVAATVLAAIAVSGLWGYYVGALRLLGFLGGLVVAYACASPVAQWLSPHIAQIWGTSPVATRLIGLLTGCGATFLLTTVGIAIVSHPLLRDRPQLEAANRLLGFGVGGIQASAAMLLLLSGIQVIEPHARQRLKVAPNGNRSAFSWESQPTSRLARAVANRVVVIADSTRRGTLGPLVAAYNPFERLPQLKNLHRAVTVVSDPEQLRKALQSPTMTRSRKNSEVRQAIESLAQDPQLRKIAESGQPLDPETAMSLLNHPGIAKLLEQPNLMQQLSDTMNELDMQSQDNLSRE